jgi:WD40 repeat protein
MRTAPTTLVACYLAALVASAPTVGDDKKTPSASKEAKSDPFHIIQTLKTEADVATAVAFSPDGTVVAVGDGQHVRFWNPRTGEKVAAPWKFDDGAVFIAFIGTKRVALAGLTNTISICEYPSGKHVTTIDLKGGVPASLIATEDMLVCGADGFVRLWDVSTWRERWNSNFGNTEVLYAMALSSDRKEIAIGTNGARVRIIAVKDGKALRDAGRDKMILPTLRGVCYSPDGREIAIAPTARDPDSRRSDDIWGCAIFYAGLTKHRTAIRWSDTVSSGEPMGCMFIPDGRTLAVPCRGSSVRLYEAETGRLRHVGGVMSDAKCFAVSPDGRLFAVAGSGPNVSIVDWRATKAGNAPLEATALDSLWSDLASPDANKGYRAVVALGASPAQAAKIAWDNLKPVPVPNEASVKSWIADLGSNNFAEREAAEKELAKLGDAIEPELRTAVKSDSNDRRAAADRLLKALARRDGPERLRAWRTVEVLEYIDTPVARDLLKALATGAPSAGLTREAKAALARLDARKSKP